MFLEGKIEYLHVWYYETNGKVIVGYIWYEFVFLEYEVVVSIYIRADER